MDHVQRSHLDLLFEQHQLNLVVCCVYAMSRVMNVSVPFKRVTEAVLSAFPTTSPKIFAEAVIKMSTKTEGVPQGSCKDTVADTMVSDCFIEVLIIFEFMGTFTLLHCNNSVKHAGLVEK